jgi:hypothetical protein
MEIGKEARLMFDDGLMGCGWKEETMRWSSEDSSWLFPKIWRFGY